MSTALTRPALLAVASLTLSACATAPKIEASTMSKPLVFEEFFAGRSTGSGVFMNTWTGYKRPFDVVINSTRDGNVLTLVEDFVYADGEKDRKTWRLTRTAPRTYTGTREDVIGEARAFGDGAAMRLEYDVSIEGWSLHFKDILAIEADGRLLNKATVSKWGFKVGTVELRLNPAAPVAANSQEGLQAAAE
jgi:hypothetical protein